MAHLFLRLLGPLQVTLDGEAINTFRTDKAQALLAYLAMHAGTPFRTASASRINPRIYLQIDPAQPASVLSYSRRPVRAFAYRLYRQVTGHRLSANAAIKSCHVRGGRHNGHRE
jgi:hypothetical protein